MFDRVPGEVLSDILTNSELSLEDVGRCSCVCKSWYSLITSPAFISLHTQQQIDSISKNKNENSLFLVRTCAPQPYFESIDEERFSLHFDDDDGSFAEYKKSLNFASSDLPYAIVNCIRGVVCLFRMLDTHTDYIILWNPTIRKCLRLPQPPEVSVLDGVPLRHVGFGFDPTANDFKVFRVLHYWWRKKRGVRYLVEVFDLSSGCWRSSTNPVRLCGDYEFGYQAFLRGVVHWFAIDMDDRKHKMIISCDLRDEEFSMMSLPDCPAVVWNVQILAMGESLSLSYNEFSGYNVICSIWVMKQYGVADSWIKQYSIDLSPGIHTLPIVGVRKNGKVLFVNKLGRNLSCYDPNKKSFKHLKQFASGKFDVVDFTESLALLGVKGKLGMLGEAEDEANSKGCPDVHMQKKMKIQSQ